MVDTSYLQEIFTWVADNKEWAFSGLGVAVVGGVCGWLFGKKQHGQQTATAKNCGSSMQAAENGRNYSVGDGSALTVNEGLSSKEVQEFLIALAKAEMEKYIGIGKAETEKRLTEFGIELCTAFSNMGCQRERLSCPSVQYSIHNAAIQYIRASDEETRKLLLSAVKKRLESGKRSIITANMDSIVSNILLLTNTQIKIIFSLCALKYFPIIARNFEEFTGNIEEIANEVLLCEKITTVDLNGIVAHGFMVDNLFAMMWNYEIQVGYYMVQCNKRIFEENLFDISDYEKIAEVVKRHFKKLNCANDILTTLNVKELSCTYAGIILTDLIFSVKFPHIRHASLEDILDGLK